MKKDLISLCLFAILLLAFLPNSVFSIDCEGTPPSGTSNQQQIEDFISACNAKINSLQSNENTLKQAISSINTKVTLAQAQINQTLSQIATLEKEVTVLSGVLDTVNKSMDELGRIYLARVRESYRRSRITPLDMIFSTSSFGDFLTKIKYLNTIKAKDQLILTELENSRLDYDQRKNEKVTKQQEVDKLRIKLIAQKKSLDDQVISKKGLLTLTQNDEKKYKQLLDQALAEKSAIEKALASSVKVGPIKKGDIIAVTGNSGYPGCSTGKHLHFEIRKDGKWTDPTSYLESKTIKDEQGNRGDVSVGSGNWPWPLEGSIRLTQFYGQTPYSGIYKYSGGVHTGFDMISTSSDVIRAPADGTLFKSSQSCGSSTINIVYIEHADNVVSFYLHVQ